MNRDSPGANRVAIRVDLQLIADMVPPGARVLDLGCGDGSLLKYLVTEKGVDGRGIELSQAGVNACVSRGLSVIQGDVDIDLGDYPDDSFDYVILSQTLPAARQPQELLSELLRIGRSAIVSFPNMGYWRARLYLLWCGRVPMTETLPDPWWSTSNIHPCSIRDFLTLCEELGITIERALTVNSRGQVSRFHGHNRLANLLGDQGVFLLSKSTGAGSPRRSGGNFTGASNVSSPGAGT
jgi:methionine biosynthesis protein MetW